MEVEPLQRNSRRSRERYTRSLKGWHPAIDDDAITRAWTMCDCSKGINASWFGYNKNRLSRKQRSNDKWCSNFKYKD